MHNTNNLSGAFENWLYSQPDIVIAAEEWGVEAADLKRVAQVFVIAGYAAAYQEIERLTEERVNV